MPQTALITGATGLLGRQVFKAFQHAGWITIGTGFTRANPPSILKVDLGNTEEVKRALDEAKPQVIVHCAANRFPDKCDADPEGTRALNVAASRALAEAAASRKIFLIYISTDYVFSGKPGEAPYQNDAKTGPTNFYGQTKLDGEEAILEATKGTGLGVVLRVPVLYGSAFEPKESAVNVLLEAVDKAEAHALAQGKGETSTKATKMDDWALRFPTNTEDVARVCQDIAKKYSVETPDADRAKLPTVLQFSAEEQFTKYEMCKLFAEILGLPLTEDAMVANKEGNDPNAAVQRPYDCHLSTKALKDLGIPVHAVDFKDWWRRELKAYRR
ncbi:RmlD substrate binding domain-containing protein [Xylona heveae TC161]|uniref:RmlD substrate binding domain-containing protein n=1 Tax=Xylona heveae (strain CBS 132557 / TC161) TaxID=1328760 RepID=A0A165AAZ0_XYLHT|nr:RmlD substrate binding domain-containing protein [Xylona heveae TC161]KZF20189.1 RmlD substrate binding domain-containing protein [Xylona heveae TC161]